MGWTGRDSYLTQEEIEGNATEVWNYFGSEGWTLNAVSAMLGNMYGESSINPGKWENGKMPYTPTAGYGIVQWTPYTNYSEWAGYGWENNGPKQCARILYEYDNGIQYYPTTAYPLTFREFAHSELTPEYLATVFEANYERPAATHPERQGYARTWYNFLSGTPPIPPTPTGGNFPICLVKRVMKRRCR